MSLLMTVTASEVNYVIIELFVNVHLKMNSTHGIIIELLSTCYSR